MHARLIVPAVMAFVATSLPAQAVPARTLQDSVLGWMKVYKFPGGRAPVTIDDKHYSTAQLSIADSLANWMQASYLPRGALGDVSRIQSAKIGAYNKSTASLPQTYGASRRSTRSSNATPTESSCRSPTVI